MEHVFTSGEGDQKLFLKFYDNLKELTDEKLIEAYHREMRIGMTGVHAQAVFVLALREVMKDRFGKSLIQIEDGIVINLI
ncbi:MAG: hypothetical protein ACKVJF_02990 [Flavobacteriales bacterium]